MTKSPTDIKYEVNQLLMTFTGMVYSQKTTQQLKDELDKIIDIPYIIDYSKSGIQVTLIR